MRGVRLSAACEARIIELYRGGKTLRQVEAETGVPHWSAHRVLVRNGIPRRKCGRALGPPSPRNSAIVAAYREGRSMPKIAAEYGISHQRVCRILNQYERCTGERVDRPVFHHRPREGGPSPAADKGAAA
jgi:transposase-like protein